MAVLLIRGSRTTIFGALTEPWRLNTFSFATFPVTFSALWDFCTKSPTSNCFPYQANLQHKYTEHRTQNNFPQPATCNHFWPLPVSPTVSPEMQHASCSSGHPPRVTISAAAEHDHFAFPSKQGMDSSRNHSEIWIMPMDEADIGWNQCWCHSLHWGLTASHRVWFLGHCQIVNTQWHLQERVTQWGFAGMHLKDHTSWNMCTQDLKLYFTNAGVPCSRADEGLVFCAETQRDYGKEIATITFQCSAFICLYVAGQMSNFSPISNVSRFHNSKSRHQQLWWQNGYVSPFAPHDDTLQFQWKISPPLQFLSPCCETWTCFQNWVLQDKPRSLSVCSKVEQCLVSVSCNINCDYLNLAGHHETWIGLVSSLVLDETVWIYNLSCCGQKTQTVSSWDSDFKQTLPGSLDMRVVECCS